MIRSMTNYYDDHELGFSFGTVRIYINGILAHEEMDQLKAVDHDFWLVSTIRWNRDNTATIIPVNRITNGFP